MKSEVLQVHVMILARLSILNSLSLDTMVQERSICDIEDITWPLGDTNFIFEC